MFSRYRYYWIRGFGRFLAFEIAQIAIWTWLVLFCTFLGTCIDYRGIMAVTTTPTSVWTFVTISRFGHHWFFVLSLVLYGVYFAWRVVKFIGDTR